ncbi:HPr family phosphocarrier protein [Zooshikella sp. RANM57]|uniref:HPr family phosphocarrier protein n=1 Tax=Zooshikella sp. RANM57 TaxID=3425863 RepID=UPI003D6EFC63
MRLKKMYQKQVEIVAENGLHIRPAALFVKAAKNFASDIVVVANGKEASAKSLVKLQLLGLSKGTIITIKAEGGDEQQAVDQLVGMMGELE